MTAPRPSPHVMLIDRKTRVVELWAPESPVARYDTDRELLVDAPLSSTEYLAGPVPAGLCFEANGRRSRFLVDNGSAGDRLLDALAARRFPVAGVTPYGPRGWAVKL